MLVHEAWEISLHSAAEIPPTDVILFPTAWLDARPYPQAVDVMGAAQLGAELTPDDVEAIAAPAGRRCRVVGR